MSTTRSDKTDLYYKVENEKALLFDNSSKEGLQESGDDTIKSLQEKLKRERYYRKQEQLESKDFISKLQVDLDQVKRLRKQDQDEIERLKIEMCNFKHEVDVLIKDLESERKEAKGKITEMMEQLGGENELQQGKIKVKINEIEKANHILLEKLQIMEDENKSLSGKIKELIGKLSTTEIKEAESKIESEKYKEINKELTSEIKKLLDHNSKLQTKNKSIMVKFERLQEDQKESNERMKEVLEKRNEWLNERKKYVQQMDVFDNIMKNLQDENKKLQDEIMKLLNKVDLLEQVHNMEDFYKLRMALIKQIEIQKKEIDHLVLKPSQTATNLMLPPKNEETESCMKTTKDDEIQNTTNQPRPSSQSVKTTDTVGRLSRVSSIEKKKDEYVIESVVDNLKQKLEEYLKSNDCGTQLLQWQQENEELTRKLQLLESENKQFKRTNY